MPLSQHLLHNKLLPDEKKASQQKTMIERHDLLLELDRCRHYPLTVIVAAAGYGKTTLAAQWFEKQQRKSRQVAWYSIDETDNDVAQFSRYFTVALTQAMGKAMPEIAYQGKLTDYFNHLLRYFAESVPAISFIIDDYQLIDNKAIHDGLRFWLKHQPQSIHLILLSRTLPPLNLSKLELNEQLLIIQARQLAFSLTETQQLFETEPVSSAISSLGPFPLLPRKKIALLWEQTSGWPVAIQLILLTLKKQPVAKNALLNVKDLLPLNRQMIDNYLNEEVFYHIDDELKHFMTRCAVLRLINEALAVLLTGQQDSLKRLYELEQQGLFIQRIPHKDDELYWKFSPIVAAYLTLQCRLTQPQHWQDLHRTAAMAWFSLGNSLEALYHARHLKETQVLFDILSADGWTLFHQGQLRQIEVALNQLPAELVWQNESLVLLKAWLAQSQHRHYEVNQILAQFTPKSPLVGELLGQFTALKAQVAINAGDEEQAFRLAREALVNLTSTADYARVVAMSVIGEAQHCRGQLKSALTTMQQVEKIAISKKTRHHWLWSKLQQAEILLAQGCWQAAYDLLNALVPDAESLQAIPMYEFFYRLKGQILCEWYQLEKAEAMANQGMAIVKEHEKAQCLTLLAKISLIRGDLDNAQRLIDDCQQLLILFPAHQDWISFLDEVRLIYWQMKAKPSTSESSMSESSMSESLKSWLLQTDFPKQMSNHFTQRQWRNIARCYLLQAQFDACLAVLNRLIQVADDDGLNSDLQRALILRSRCYDMRDQKKLAQKDLIYALGLSRQTQFISAFVIEGEGIARQIHYLLQNRKLDKLTAHKGKFILRCVNQHNQHKFAHFDKLFVSNLVQNPKMPEILKISPLTLREWQVLGLIYSGFSNEQIAQELFVAITTVKTHVRNTYQKLGVSNRREAIDYTKNLLTTLGYPNYSGYSS